ncbi:hypothetical protein BD324DRAFT_652967 [Kockovaella imperatae]|uniref:Myb-like domain-containing protein n=1 Tax=Kockovaella imperatae TaxID=4999 RepID=A0A1Y1UB09_9TREE|nr:hypothetical protein BD324DRAFT_652967 [Kockovaella imperatae]ORX34707.1 hypothetical protein BD324DRAFT_652967 [Kockovaella imperatae]
MPRVMKALSCKQAPKPYTKPEADEVPSSGDSGENSHAPRETSKEERSLMPTTEPKGSAKPVNRPWTVEELKVIFHFVVKHGAPGSEQGWEGVVPGRSGAQARSLWRTQLMPRLEDAIKFKAKEHTKVE